MTLIEIKEEEEEKHIDHKHFSSAATLQIFLGKG